MKHTVSSNALVPLLLHDVKLGSVYTHVLASQRCLSSCDGIRECSLFQTITLVSGQAQQIFLVEVGGTAGISSFIGLVKGHTISFLGRF